MGLLGVRRTAVRLYVCQQEKKILFLFPVDKLLSPTLNNFEVLK
jgi:hypothetical protein